MRAFAFVLLGLNACTSFATVRSATVSPGPQLIAQIGATPSPGDQVGWFYSMYCVSQCDHPIPATDINLAFGGERSNAARTAYTIGVGVSGLTAYVEGYVQLQKSPRTPFGLGGRLGRNQYGMENQVYARVDAPIRENVNLLWNPGLFWLSGQSPNGENPGRIVALVNGLGVEFDEGPVAFTPSLSLVMSRAGHTSGIQRHGPETRAFLTGAISMAFRRTASQ
jgi:hypothetical protein